MERRKNVKRGSLRDMAREGIEWIRRILEEKGIDPLEAKRRTCRKRQREAEGEFFTKLFR